MKMTHFTTAAAVAAFMLLPGANALKAQGTKKKTPSSEKASSSSTKSKKKKTSSSSPSAKKDKAAADKALKDAEKLIGKLSSSQKGKFTRVLNSGKKEDLAKLPGVGDVRAAAIIKGRPLKSSAHIIQINGVGMATLENIVNYYAKGQDKKADAKNTTPKKSSTTKKPSKKKSSSSSSTTKKKSS